MFYPIKAKPGDASSTTYTWCSLSNNVFLSSLFELNKIKNSLNSLKYKIKFILDI